MPYKAFISYSHAADGQLAPALQSALHRFAKPLFKMRALKVFRDKTSLSANPALWPSIEKALSESEYFLLLASPQAARSPWVHREIAWWLEHRSIDTLLILVTGGELLWDSATQDFDWERTTALPGVLKGQFHDEPLYIDLRWANSEDQLSLRHSQFRGAVLDIAATLHGRAKDELDGEDVRQHRLTKIVTSAAVVMILAFAVTAAWQWHVAGQQRDEALRQKNTAVSRELAVHANAQLPSDPELGVLLAMEAVKASRTAEAEDALRQALVESHVRVKLDEHPGRVTTAPCLAPMGS
jgi:hypothetical protein